MTDTQCKNMTLNDLFEIHMDTRKLAESTQANYRRMWNSLVRNELGQMKVVQVRPISCTPVLIPAEQTEIFPQYHQVSP